MSLLVLLDGGGVEARTQTVTDQIASQGDSFGVGGRLTDLVTHSDPAKGVGVGLKANSLAASDQRSLRASVLKADTVPISDPRSLRALVLKADLTPVSDPRSLRSSVSKADTVPISDPRGAGVGLKANALAASDQRAVRAAVSKTDLTSIADPRGAGVGLKADGLTVSDTRRLAASLSATETSAVSDPRRAGVGLKADGLAVADRRLIEPRLPKTDVVSLSDQRGAGVGLKADSVTVSEQKSLSGAVSKSDLTAVSDPRGAGVGLEADSVSVADRRSLRPFISKADTVPLSDPRGAGVGLKADTVAASDRRALLLGTSKVDTLATQDARRISITSALSEALIVLDQASVGVLVTNIISALDRVDLAVALNLLDKVAVEDLQYIDNGSPVVSRLITDTLVGGGAIGVGAGVTNTISALDRTFVNALVGLIDTAILSDPRLVLLGLSKTDTVKITDQGGQGLTVRPADALVLGDVRRILAGVVEDDDLAAGGDTVSHLQAWHKLLTDTITTSHSFKAGVGLINAVGAADLRSILAGTTRSEQLTAHDNLGLTGGVAHSDSVPAGQRLGAGVGLVNTFKASDIVTAVQQWVVSVLDDVEVSDATKQNLAIALRDTALVEEVVTAAMSGGNSAYLINTVQLVDTLSILINAVFRDSINGSDRLYPGVRVSDAVRTSEGHKGIGAGLQSGLGVAERPLTRVSQSTRDEVDVLDTKALRPGVRLVDNVTSTQSLRQNLQAALVDKVAVSDQKTLRAAVSQLVDQLLVGESKRAQAQPRLVDALRTNDSVAQSVLLSLSDGVVLSQAAVKLGLAMVDTLTLVQLHQAAANLLHADAATLQDSKTLAIFKAVTDTTPVVDGVTAARGLRLVLQDTLLSSDRLDLSVRTLIREAITVLDEAVNDGIPGAPVLFLKFTEQVLRTHGFTKQALMVQRFVDQTLRSVSGRKDEEGF